jgi:hypothetical protein
MIEQEEGMLKTIVVYQVDVLNLPPIKAEAFLERLRDHLKPQTEKFAEVGTIVIPVRNQGSRIYVYALTEDSLEEVKPMVLSHGKLIDIHEEDTPESVSDYVKLMLGAPVISLDQDKLDAIEYYVDKAFQYDVNNKRQYVLEEVQAEIEEEKQ